MARSPRTHVLALSAAALALIGGLAAAVTAIFSFEPACVADYSEDTIVAPDSPRGRLLCTVTDGELGDSMWPIVVIAVTAVALVAVAVMLWARRRPVWLLVATLATAVALPWLAVGAIAAAPADCTPAQWKTYGDSGCERNEELRPGLGQYWGTD